MTPAPTPAPLSVGLLCVYKQYKADTETIASWLKANAVKHGYKFDGQDGVIIGTSDFIPSEFVCPFRFLSFARPLPSADWQQLRGDRDGHPPQSTSS